MKQLALTLVSIGFCLVSSPAFGLDAAIIWYAAESLNSKSRVVLLIHGYQFGSAINCPPYFSGMKEAIAAKRYEATGKKNIVKTVGWYGKDKHCDEDIVGSWNNDVRTRIDTIARELGRHIRQNYTMETVTVDIVAHSLGGLIVRKMLELMGDDLWVEDVVTLGTPHAGFSVGVGITGLGCNLTLAYDSQCKDASSGSAFIKELEHNPQSIVRTAWTIIGSKNDKVVGPDTSGEMDQGDDSRPEVVEYEYPDNYRDGNDCDGGLIGHDTLVHNRPVVDCPSGMTKANPTALVLDGINRVH